MKKLAFLLTFAMAVLVSNAQLPDCSSVKSGKFRSVVEVDNQKIVTIITREGDKQYEENEQAGLKMEFAVKWTSACSYELSNPRVVKGSLPGVSPSHVLYVRIIDVKKDMYVAEVATNFSESKIVFEFSILK